MRKYLLFLALLVCVGGMAQPAISSFSPVAGGTGTAITVTGTNFTSVTAVSFGGTAAASFSVLSSTTLVAIVGSGSSGSLSITTAGGTTAMSGFTFVPAPSISSFSPMSATYGNTVTITGTNLSNITSVYFGPTAAASFTTLSSTTLTAVVGLGSSGDVSVTSVGGTAAFSGFIYITPGAPTITSFAPLTATTGGTVTITGTNLSTTLNVSFGSTFASSFTVLSSTSVSAVVSSGSTGSITITTAGGTAALSGFTYSPPPLPPTIASFSPLTGTTGSVITVKGTNFTGTTAVKFGGTAAASFSVLSSTTLTAVVAAGSSGGISITNAGGTVGLSGFTYSPPSTAASIASFTPIAGTAGAVITITGANLGGLTSVKFGNGATSFSYTVFSSTTVAVVIPVGALSGNVSIASSAGPASLAGFAYTSPPPTIVSFTPTTGPPGTVVTVTGTFLTGASSVKIGGVSAASFTVASSSTLTTVVANGLSGSISITTPGGTTSLPGFTMIGAPIIGSLLPLSGTTGTSVTITGSNFNTIAANNIIFFGATRATVVSASSDRLTVTVPSGASYGSVTVLNAATYLLGTSAVKFAPVFAGKAEITVSDFAAKADLSSGGNNPTNVLTGDLDGDGKPDMAVINSDNSNIAFFLNTSTTNGAISFAAPVILSSGTNPFAGSLGDLDGDGKLDLAVTELNSNKINVLLNKSTVGNLNMGPSSFTGNGSGTLLNGNLFVSTLQRPVDVAIADIDGDGKQDLIVTNTNSDYVSVYLNTSVPGGQLSFTTSGSILSLAANTGPFNLIVRDIDQDGLPDLVVGHQFSNTAITVFRNNSVVGLVSFSVPLSLLAGSAPWGVKVGDLDGDGKPEIVAVSFTSGTLSLYRNISPNGGGIVLSPKIDLAIPSPSYSFEMVDLNGDGKLDLAIANSFSNTISILTNTSAGGAISFTGAITLPAAEMPGSVTAADFNGDGKPDLVTANRLPGGNNISIFRNQLLPLPTINSFTPLSATTGGIITISGTNLTGTTAVSLGGVAASFTVLSSTTITAVAGSGASGSISITTGQGSTSISGFIFVVPVKYVSISSFLPASGPVGSTVIISGTNFNTTAAENIVYFGAARAQVVSVSGDSILSVIVPTGSTYQPISVTTKNTTAYSAKAFLVSFIGGEKAFTVRSFLSAYTSKLLSQPSVLTMADLNRDGKTDVLLAYNDSVGFSVLKNTSTVGNFSFKQQSVPAAGKSSQGITTADLDGDGLLDVILTNIKQNYFSIYRNTSTGDSISFAARQDISLAFNLSATVIGISDLNNDGKPDIVFGTESSDIIIMKNNTAAPGDIKMTLAKAYGLTGIIRSMSLSDMNADGLVDIVVSTTSSSLQIQVLKNTSLADSIAFNLSQSLTITVPAIGYSLATGDINGDGKPDIVWANSVDDKLVVYKNKSTKDSLSFEKIQVLSTPGFPQSVFITDMNGDGKPDVGLTAFNSNKIAVFRNLGSSDTTILAVPYLTDPNNTYNTLAVGSVDLDGDSLPDIAGITMGQNQFTVYRNTVRKPLISSFTPSNTTRDAVITIKGKNFTGTTAVGLGGFPSKSFTLVSDSVITATIRYTSTGYLTVTNTYGVDSAYGLVGVAPRIDSLSTMSALAGSKLFIYGANFDSVAANNIVYFGAVPGKVTDAGTRKLTVTVPAGATYSNVSVTTGLLTAYSVNRFIPTYTNTGTLYPSNFYENSQDIKTEAARYSLIKDMTGDGKPELLTGSYYGENKKFTVLRNATTISGGLASFPDSTVVAINKWSYISTGDFDGDGLADVVSYSADLIGHIDVFLNTSKGNSISFGDKKSFDTYYPANTDWALITDVDNDGRNDIIVTQNGSSVISIYLNTSSGPGDISFAKRIDLESGAAPFNIFQLAAGDLNKDGKPDLVFTSATSFLSVLKNTSSPGKVSFAPRVTYATKYSPYTVLLGDLDGDDKLDIAASYGTDSSITIFRNTTSADSISFTNKMDVPLPNIGFRMQLADMNGDKKPDIVYSGEGLWVRYNTSTIDSISFRNGSNMIQSGGDEVAIGDLDGDGVPEIVVNNEQANKLTISKNTIKPGKFYAFSPRSGGTGSTITIKGTGLTGLKAIAFGSQPATSFKIVSDSVVTAIVGAGASGFVRIEWASAKDSIDGFSFLTCDNTITLTPGLVNYSVDTTVCFKGEMTLTVDKVYPYYLWSTGEGSRSITVKTTSVVNVLVASTAQCYSKPSASVTAINNPNPIPVLALSGDVKLISSTAPNYRWYYNNNLLPTEKTSSLTATKIGFYKVETSQDKTCWDASNEFPILFVTTPLVNDSVSIKAFPNPTSGTFNVVATLQRVTNVTAKVTVTDAAGNTLLQTNKFIFFGKEIKIPVTLTVKGPVFVKLDVNGDVKTITVILQ